MAFDRLGAPLDVNQLDPITLPHAIEDVKEICAELFARREILSRPKAIRAGPLRVQPGDEVQNFALPDRQALRGDIQKVSRTGRRVSKTGAELAARLDDRDAHAFHRLRGDRLGEKRRTGAAAANGDAQGPAGG